MNKFDEAKLIDLWNDNTRQTDQSFRDAQDEANLLEALDNGAEP